METIGPNLFASVADPLHRLHDLRESRREAARNAVDTVSPVM